MIITLVMKFVDVRRMMRHSLGTRPDVWAACEEGENVMQTQVYGNVYANGAHDALFGLTESVVASIMAHAIAQQPPTPTTTRRGTMLANAQAAVLKGEAPAPLVFKSQSNRSYQKHADALYDLAALGDLDALQAYPLSGTNTYARALHKYRGLLVATVTGALRAGALPPQQCTA
jgi:hypothetical protein